jgi:lysophospholipase L1-like esterase
MVPTKKLFTILAILLVILGATVILLENSMIITDSEKTHVACIGDSLTEATNYPRYLQTMLGAGYKVENFGVSGATVLLNSDQPYLNTTAFQDAKNAEPHIAVIMLGTNDARNNTYLYSKNFEADYKQLIEALQALSSKPKIYLALPPPIFDNFYGLESTNMLQGVIPRIKQVANELNLQTINVYGALDHPEYFPDGVHPNNQGAKLIAKAIFSAIK